MENYECYSVWSLIYDASYKGVEHRNAMDPYLANKLHAVYDLRNIGARYLLDLTRASNDMPITKAKINNIIRMDINNGYQWYLFKSLTNMLDQDIIMLYVNKWFNEGFGSFCEDNREEWIISVIQKNNFKTTQELLIRMLAEYKKSKKQSNLKIINTLFSICKGEELEQAVVLIKESSSAVKALLLTKAEELTEKDVLVGLRAMSNLKRQRGINFKIKFKSLECLGPKSRLDVMKQLLGTLDEYYVWMQQHPKEPMTWWLERKMRRLQNKSKEFNIPFEQMPNREEVERFLFPCSLKYNSEVVSVMKRYDDLISKEKENDNE